MPSGTNGTLTWAWSHEGGATQIQLGGEFDLVVAGALRDAVEKVLTDETDMVRLDLEEISFMDSTGLRFLLETKRSLDERQVDLVISNPSPIVRRVIEVSGMTEFFALNEAAPESELFDVAG